jgi:hypothetical protein
MLGLHQALPADEHAQIEHPLSACDRHQTITELLVR